MPDPSEAAPPPKPGGEGQSPSDRDPSASPSKDSLPTSLPVMPLSDVVVFPFMVAPLLVNTKSSIRLVDEVVAGDRLLLLVLQKKPDQEDPEPKDLHEFGCAARVLKMLKFPDDSTRVLVQGIRRARITSFEKGPAFLRATIHAVEDSVGSDIEMEALARAGFDVWLGARRARRY